MVSEKCGPPYPSTFLPSNHSFLSPSIERHGARRAPLRVHHVCHSGLTNTPSALHSVGVSAQARTPPPALSPWHQDPLTLLSNSSLPTAVVSTKAAALQRTTRILNRSTLCHCVSWSRVPRLPPPIHTSLVMLERPRGKSLAHSAWLPLQAKSARPHSPPLSALFLLVSRVFQADFPGEHSVSCGWTLCTY